MRTTTKKSPQKQKQRKMKREHAKYETTLKLERKANKRAQQKTK